MYGQNTRRVRRTRHYRKVQIMNVLYYWLYRDGLTMRQVAFWCQICPSSHLMGILKEMQAGGDVKALEASHRPNSSKFIWRLTERGEAIVRSRTIEDWTPR